MAVVCEVIIYYYYLLPEEIHIWNLGRLRDPFNQDFSLDKIIGKNNLFYTQWLLQRI